MITPPFSLRFSLHLSNRVAQLLPVCIIISDTDFRFYYPFLLSYLRPAADDIDLSSRSPCMSTNLAHIIIAPNRKLVVP